MPQKPLIPGEPNGWFSDIDDDADPRSPWRPYVQLNGMCVPLRVGFFSEKDCDRFIMEQIVGLGAILD